MMPRDRRRKPFALETVEFVCRIATVRAGGPCEIGARGRRPAHDWQQRRSAPSGPDLQNPRFSAESRPRPRPGGARAGWPAFAEKRLQSRILLAMQRDAA